jgi:hypothetical protein
MKQAGRIRILVFTTMLAAMTFAVVWLTRPAADNEMIEIAKSRQLQPLMEIDQPARLSKTVDDENRQTAEDLYPYLSEKIKADKTLTDFLVATVGDEFDQRLSTYTNTTLPTTLSTFQKSVQDQVDQALAAQKNATDAELVQLKKDVSAQIKAQVPQAVDAMIPSLVTALVKEFSDHQDTYLPQLAEALKPYQSLDEEQLKSVYLAYRNAIIADLVPAILDQGEAEVKAEIDTYLDSRFAEFATTYPAATEATQPAATLEAESQAPTAEETSAVVTESAQPVASEATAQTEKAATAEPVAETSATTEEETESTTVAVAETTETSVISAPEITEKETPVTLTQEDYMTQREKIRQQAIQDVLNKIGSGT